MKEHTLKTKLLTVLLTLCMVLSIVPITAYAGELPKPDYLPEGVTYSNDYDHTYHTQVNVTANVSVKDSDGTVVETTQVSKSTEEFLKGGVGMLQSNIARLQTEIETPYQDKGTLARENESGQLILDHFESAELYTFIPTSGDPVEFGMDLDAAKKYFNEHPDATGTFTKLLDMHEYHKYNYTYDLTVQENSQPASTITSAAVQNMKFNYQPGDAPQATAEVYNADADKYEIAYECWQQFKGNEPVAAWYSDNGAHGSLPTITEFESGEKYVYFLMLKAKNGRTFAATDSGLTVTVNGWTVEQQNISVNLDGQSVYVTGIATITPTKPVEPKEIEVIEINNATLTFKGGDKPVFTGTVPENDQYAFRCEWWSLDENTGIVSTEPEWGGEIYKNKITTFEAGKTYHYGVYVTAYYGNFSPDAKLKINGQEVKYTRIGDENETQSLWVETDLTMMPTAAGASDYKIIEGANGTWTQNSDGTLVFRANGDFDKFTGVKVDGTLIDAKNYTAVSGSTVITLKADYLKTLSVGTHKLTVVYTDGECSANFEVKKVATEQTKPTEGDKTDTTTPTGGKDTTSPQTGDNSNLALWFAILFISCGGVIGVTVYSRRRKLNKR